MNSDTQDPLSITNDHAKFFVFNPNPIHTQTDVVPMYKCPECPKIFKLKYYLLKHSYVHVTEKRFGCDICPKIFKTPDILKTHKKTHEIGDKTYECDICLEKFPNEYLYKIHITRNNTRIEPCPQCDSKFHFKKDLDLHVFKYHTKVKYSCYICKEEQNDTLTLLKHIEDTHEVTKAEFQCEYCGKYTICKRSLKQHIKLMHKELPGLICEICGYKTILKYKLKDHMMKHTLEKPDLCTVCGKSFAKGTLKVHRLVHTGEKPHKCKYCDKRFTQRGPLKIHMRSHTGEKPHKCDICLNSFVSSFALKHHKKSKHNVI